MTSVWPVIVTRDRPHELIEQVSRLLPQLQGSERVVVVVDGCEETRRAITCPLFDPRVLPITLVASVGPDVGRRIGVAQVPPDAVVCKIDDHDYAEPGLLTHVRDAFTDPGVVTAYCDVYLQRVLAGSDVTAVRAELGDEAAEGVAALEAQQHRALCERTVKRKDDGPYCGTGHLGYGLSAYRKWAYDLVGGQPLDYAPVNDYALLCMIEQLLPDSACHIPLPLVTVIEDGNGFSSARKTERLRRTVDVANTGLRGGFPLPYRAEARPVLGAQPQIAPAPPRSTAHAVPALHDGDAPLAPTGSREPLVPASAPTGARVGIVSKVLGPGYGGGELSMLAIIRGLAAHGMDVHVFYEQDGGAQPFTDPSFTAHKVDPLTVEHLIPPMQAAGLNVALVTGRDAVEGVMACEAVGVPAVLHIPYWWNLILVTPGGIDAMHKRPIPSSYVDRPGVEVLGRAQAVVVNSEWTAEVVEGTLDRTPDVVCYPTIDADAVVPVDAPPVSERRYVTCPTCEPAKGADTFVAMAQRCPDVEFLLLAGQAAHHRGAAKLVAQAEALPNVTVRSEWVQDMREVYAETRCLFIGTKTAESFCRAAAEARACGIPLLTTNAGNLSRINGEGAGVMLGRTATGEAFAKALRGLLGLDGGPPPKVSASRKWCIDHTDRVAALLEDTRHMSEVAIVDSTAPGLHTACAQFRDTLGVHVLKTCEAPACQQYALLIGNARLHGPMLRPENGPAAVLWHSHMAQMDMNRHELQLLLPLMRKVLATDHVTLCMTSEPDALALRACMGEQVRWLPVPFTVPERVDLPDADGDASRRVFIPGPYHPRKNVGAALLAIREAGGIPVFTGLARRHRDVLDAAHALCGEVHMEPCAEAADVLALAASCRATVCVSLAETFCYAAAECVAVGTPTVWWQGIPAMRSDVSVLEVTDPTDVGQIADRLRTALGDGGTLAARQREALVALCATRAKITRQTLREMIHAGR